MQLIHHIRVYTQNGLSFLICSSTQGSFCRSISVPVPTRSRLLRPSALTSARSRGAALRGPPGATARRPPPSPQSREISFETAAGARRLRSGKARPGPAPPRCRGCCARTRGAEGTSALCRSPTAGFRPLRTAGGSSAPPRPPPALSPAPSPAPPPPPRTTPTSRRRGSAARSRWVSAPPAPGTCGAGAGRRRRTGPRPPSAPRRPPRCRAAPAAAARGRPPPPAARCSAAPRIGRPPAAPPALPAAPPRRCRSSAPAWRAARRCSAARSSSRRTTPLSAAPPTRRGHRGAARSGSRCRRAVGAEGTGQRERPARQHRARARRRGCGRRRPGGFRGRPCGSLRTEPQPSLPSTVNRGARRCAALPGRKGPAATRRAMRQRGARAVTGARPSAG